MVEDHRQPRATVESNLTAIPSTPVTHGATHTLSAADHAMGLHSLHLIFYYRESPFTPSFDIFDPAWTSLAEALSLYQAVTGRLIRRRDGRSWEVKCNDAGVRTIRAKVGGATVEEWLKTAGAVDERDLAAWEDLPEDPHIWSPFRFQLNDFEEGGIAIGVSCTHLLADLPSAAALIKTWTDIHRHEPIEPNRAPPVPNPGSNHLSHNNYYKTKSHEITQPTSPIKMATATFNFSNLVIKEQILEAKKTLPGLDPFDYLCSLFWTRIRNPGPNQDDHSTISVCVDFRKLLSTPPGQFGNFLHFFPVSIPGEEFSRGLGHVAGIVHDRIEKLGQDDFWSASEWLESNRDKRFTMYGPELTFVNMEHVPIYDAVFGDKKRPVHVSCHVGGVNGEGLVMVLPSPEGGNFGRTVTVVLPEKDMARVCEDQEIMKLKPRIFLKGDHMI